jgi:hypothetical protein
MSLMFVDCDHQLPLFSILIFFNGLHTWSLLNQRLVDFQALLYLGLQSTGYRFRRVNSRAVNYSFQCIKHRIITI